MDLLFPALRGPTGAKGFVQSIVLLHVSLPFQFCFGGVQLRPLEISQQAHLRFVNFLESNTDCCGYGNYGPQFALLCGALLVGK